MKLKFTKLSIILLGFSMLSGCSGANFFDVQSAMNVPKLQGNQEEVKKCVTEYMNSDLIWKYTWFENGYAAVIKCDFGREVTPVYVACCQSPEESKRIHILFINKVEKNWKVVYDSIHFADDIENIELEDIDNDQIKEIVIYNKNFENTARTARYYKFENNIIREIKNINY
ncbi:MAG: hypothetical protein ACI4PR_00945 [Acutalibacteraceae bacterium]